MITEHLKERHLNIKLHRPIIDEQLNIATFLCFNFSGQIVGYQQYNPSGNKKIFNSKSNGRYYTYRNKLLSTICVWGLESYYQSAGPIFITEGIFDAARLTELGQTAFALLSNDAPKDYNNWLHSLNRPIIAICDNDSAGQKLIKFGDRYEIVTRFKDLGSASDDYIKHIIKKFQTV